MQSYIADSTLTKRLVREYYRILLSHKEALDAVGVDALRVILTRLPEPNFYAQIQSQLATILANQEKLLGLERTKTWRKVHWPDRSYDPTWPLQPLMLRPEYQLVDYVGQAHEQTRDDLLGWLRNLANQPQGECIGLRCYVGPGGAGKTRLLLEVGRILQAEGWFTGFLVPGGTTPETAYLLLEATNPTLLVLDYAGVRQSEVDALLDALATARDREHPYALVLLDRSEPDWLQDAVQQGSDPDYRGRPELQIIGTIESKACFVPQIHPQDLPDLYRASLRGLAAAVGKRPSSNTPPSHLPSRPLYVLLLALLAMAGESFPENTRDEMSILDSVWTWVVSRWRTNLSRDKEMNPAWVNDLAPSNISKPGILEELQVVTTLGHVFASEDDLANFLTTQDWLPRDKLGRTPDALWLVHRIAQFLPTYQDQPGIVASIQPDSLADYVLARRLAKSPELVTAALPSPEGIATASISEVPEALEQYARLLLRVLETLDRLEEAPQGENPAQQGQKTVEKWLDEVSRFLPQEKACLFLNAIHFALPVPDRTLALRFIQVPVYQLMVTFAVDDHERAQASGMLGYSLSALGRREEALAATEEAVDIRRKLANKNPDAFLPDLAMSLNNLGAILSELGKREEALVATEEAVEKYRQLAKKNPDAFLPDLAASLNNLGNRLSELGKREEALVATEEAVEIRRQLAKKNPDAFLPDLAMSLGAHGSVLRGMERHKEAAESFEEGLKLLRPLLQKTPAAFSMLGTGLLQDYVASAQAAGVEPDEGLVGSAKEILTEHSQVDAASELEYLFNMIEAAAKSDEPTTHEIYKTLSEIQDNADVPEELRRLAERLISILHGERNRDKLVAGLPTELSGAMDELLSRISPPS